MGLRAYSSQNLRPLLVALFFLLLFFLFFLCSSVFFLFSLFFLPLFSNSLFHFVLPSFLFFAFSFFFFNLSVAQNLIFLGLNFVTISLNISFVKNHYLGPSREGGRKEEGE